MSKFRVMVFSGNAFVVALTGDSMPALLFSAQGYAIVFGAARLRLVAQYKGRAGIYLDCLKRTKRKVIA